MTAKDTAKTLRTTIWYKHACIGQNTDTRTLRVNSLSTAGFFEVETGRGHSNKLCHGTPSKLKTLFFELVTW